jgi:hypothetical protein
MTSCVQRLVGSLVADEVLANLRPPRRLPRLGPSFFHFFPYPRPRIPRQVIRRGTGALPETVGRCRDAAKEGAGEREVAYVASVAA